MIISAYLRDALKEQGRSQRWLASKTGMNEKTLSGKFSRNSFSAAQLLLIAEALDLDLNVLKGSSNSPAYYDVYKVYDEAIDNMDFPSVITNIERYLPELPERLQPVLAVVVMYMIKCGITYDEFVVLMCSDLMTIEQLLDNYYWLFRDVSTEDELTALAETQHNGDVILSLPHVFIEQGCLVFCDPPFTRFDGDKLVFVCPVEDF